MKTNIEFYTPSESFKKIKEHVCVTRNDEIIAIVGNNHFIDCDEGKEWIETVANSVILSLAFMTYRYIECVNVWKDIRIKRDELIKNALDNSNLNLNKEQEEKITNKILKKIEELTQ